VKKFIRKWVSVNNSRHKIPFFREKGEEWIFRKNDTKDEYLAFLFLIAFELFCKRINIPEERNDNCDQPKPR